MPPARVADYLAAADFLLLPNSASTPLSIRHTSPMKAFEYMAAERPVIASDLPSIREIFQHEVNALLVPPDDPEQLRAAIRRLLDEPQLRVCVSREARRRVEGLTWDHRAGDILEFARRRGALLSQATPGATGSEYDP